MPNQAGTATGLNNFLTSNPRGDDFYSMNYRVDHNLTDKQRFFVRYSRNNRVENRGNWTGGQRSADATLSPHQRRRERRPRLDDEPVVAAQRPRELVAVPGAEHPPAPGALRSGQSRLPVRRESVLRRQPVLPAVRVRRRIVQRPWRHLLRRDERQHLFVPADVDARARQPQLPIGRGLPRVPRGKLPERALRRSLRFRARAARVCSRSSWTTPRPPRSARIWQR